jgi:hypothetical protein
MLFFGVYFSVCFFSLIELLFCLLKKKQTNKKVIAYVWGPAIDSNLNAEGSDFFVVLWRKIISILFLTFFPPIKSKCSCVGLGSSFVLRASGVCALDSGRFFCLFV